jgi:hypothetical protein
MKNAYAIRNYFNRTTLTSKIKYTVLAVTLFASFTFIGWAVSMVVQMVGVIDLIG